MDNNMIKCKICNKNFENFVGLSGHISRGHKISIKEYYDSYIKNGNDGICEICGKETSFLGIRGYLRYCCVKCAEANSETSVKRKSTNLKKYGYYSHAKSKDVQNKIKQTMKERYGAQYPLQSLQIKNKMKNSLINKYGGYTLQSNELIKKVKNTNLKKYGVENPFQSEDIKLKIKETCLEKYGVENPSQNDEIIQKIKKSRVENGDWISDKDRDEYDLYQKQVRFFTEKSLKDKYSIYDLEKRSLCGIDDGYQVDHKYSISKGFQHNIPPEIIGCKSNLELVPWLSNTKKHNKCSITQEELIQLYKNELKEVIKI